MTGVPALREAIAGKTAELYGYQPDVNSEITVTAGATEALYAAITALVRRGDEVICSIPAMTATPPRWRWPAASYVVLRCSRRIFASTGGNLPPP